MKDFVAARWRAILSHNGLLSFDALWDLDAAWFEEPNRRRGGWSGVARCELTLPEGGTAAIFLKRQENHGTFSWRHPLRGVPTFLREFRKIEHYRACGIPTLEPVYFGMRRRRDGHRAILATAELSGFESMEDRVARWLKDGAPPCAGRRDHLRAAADLLGAMHARGIQHNCFFPKHVFTRRQADGTVEARVIDLEKSRWRPVRAICASRDLYSLIRQSLCWSRTDRLWFFKRYLGIDRLTPYAKWLWRRIAARAFRKNRIPARATALVPKRGAAE
jgi:hypothetical protein